MPLQSFVLRLDPSVRSQPSYTDQADGTAVRLAQNFVNRRFRGSPPEEVVLVVDVPGALEDAMKGLREG